MPAGLQLRVRRAGATAVLSVAGELDIAVVAPLRVRLCDLVADARTERLVVDLTALAFIDVAGINALLEAAEAQTARGRVLELRRPPALLRRVLAILELEQRLPVAAGD